MLIKLTSTQISSFWNDIKFTLVQANQVPTENVLKYTNRALEKLLSGQYQCWIIFVENPDKTRDIYAISITAILEDQLFGFKFLELHSIYGFKVLEDEMAIEVIKGLTEFALANDCVKMNLTTDSERIEFLARITGFEEGYKNFFKML